MRGGLRSLRFARACSAGLSRRRRLSVGWNFCQLVTTRLLPQREGNARVVLSDLLQPKLLQPKLLQEERLLGMRRRRLRGGLATRAQQRQRRLQRKAFFTLNFSLFFSTLKRRKTPKETLGEAFSPSGT